MTSIQPLPRPTRRPSPPPWTTTTGEAPPSAEQASARTYPLQFLCDWAHSILDDDTRDLLEYRNLMNHPKNKDTWTKSFSREIRSLNHQDYLFPHQTRNSRRAKKRYHIRPHCVHLSIREERSQPNKNNHGRKPCQLPRRLWHPHRGFTHRQINAKQHHLHS
jgi:hypothetical protein